MTVQSANFSYCLCCTRLRCQRMHRGGVLAARRWVLLRYAPGRAVSPRWAGATRWVRRAQTAGRRRCCRSTAAMPRALCALPDPPRRAASSAAPAASAAVRGGRNQPARRRAVKACALPTMPSYLQQYCYCYCCCCHVAAGPSPRPPPPPSCSAVRAVQQGPLYCGG